MIRRKAFMEAGMFDESTEFGEDYDLYLRVARDMTIVQCPYWIVDYRQHRSNVSRDKERMLAGTLAVLDKIEATLTTSDRKRLRHARRRWKHEFLPTVSPVYRAWSLYYSFRAMLTVPIRFYFNHES